MNRFIASVLAAVLAFGAGVRVGYEHAPVRYLYRTGVEVESPLIGTHPVVAEILELWRQEVARRFPHAFVYSVHGTSLGGEWWCQTPDLKGLRKVRDLALELRERFPERVIVLIICNPGGHSLGVPGVYYARNNVWFYPDKYRDHPYPGDADPDRVVVGNIYEFTDE